MAPLRAGFSDSRPVLAWKVVSGPVAGVLAGVGLLGPTIYQLGLLACRMAFSRGRQETCVPKMVAPGPGAQDRVRKGGGACEEKGGMSSENLCEKCSLHC